MDRRMFFDLVKTDTKIPQLRVNSCWQLTLVSQNLAVQKLRE
jgi:hypothetical protein